MTFKPSLLTNRYLENPTCFFTEKDVTSTDPAQCLFTCGLRPKHRHKTFMQVRNEDPSFVEWLLSVPPDDIRFAVQWNTQTMKFILPRNWFLIQDPSPPSPLQSMLTQSGIYAQRISAYQLDNWDKPAGVGRVIHGRQQNVTQISFALTWRSMRYWRKCDINLRSFIAS